jgi:hypothetical protein
MLHHESLNIPPMVAMHVLFHFGQGGVEAGSFFAQLLRLMGAADRTNMAKLWKAFPEYGQAFFVGANEPDGIETLQGIAAQVSGD